MIAIYKPTGNAKEYGSLACNLYKGCGHGCSYCYVPSVLRMDRKEFYNNPQPRTGVIEALKKEAPKYQGKEVFLCFTCDPYQPINKKYQLTRQAIEILHKNDITVNILTKGVITDFDLLAKRPTLSKVGVTFDGTEIFSERLFRNSNLDEAKKHGIATWASLEPIIDTKNIMLIIEHWIKNNADIIKLGKWNYDKRSNDIDWHKFVNEAVNLLERLGCKYYIKESLQKYLIKERR